jgi:hypothetical protein
LYLPYNTNNLFKQWEKKTIYILFFYVREILVNVDFSLDEFVINDWQ